MSHGAQTTNTQKIHEGVGAIFHRRYWVEFEKGERTAASLMKTIQADLNHFSPQIMARFEKTKGDPDVLNVGDEFMIHISGPWNGPVRVRSVSPSSFSLETLEGHLEAGQITFAITDKSEMLRFEIESFARSKDKLVDLVYDKVPVARLAQTEMWNRFCTAVACHAISEDDLPDGLEVKIFTERQDEKTGKWETL